MWPGTAGRSRRCSTGMRAVGVPGPEARRGVREPGRRMIDGGGLIARAGGLAWPAPGSGRSSPGSSSAATWTSSSPPSANVTEDMLEARGAPFYQVDPDHVDDRALWEQGYYRFYDHVVSARGIRPHGGLHARLLRAPGGDVAGPDDRRRPLHARAGALARGQGLGGTVAATCARHGVPLFVPAAPDGPLAEGYRDGAAPGPGRGLLPGLRDRARIIERSCAGPGTSALFLGGGVPKDFIQIIATSVCAIRGGARAPSPHVAAIQITTDNTVFGGLGGAERGDRVHLVGQGVGRRATT